MTEVLKALQELNVCWKKIGQYNMKCRWIFGMPGHHEGMVNNSMHDNGHFGDESAIIESDDVIRQQNLVKFEVQVIFFNNLSAIFQSLYQHSLYKPAKTQR